jgi:hypothetical protein
LAVATPGRGVLHAGQDTDWNLDDLLLGVGGLMKNNQIDAIVALDDFDVERPLTCAKTCAYKAWGKPQGVTSETSSRCACAKSCGISNRSSARFSTTMTSTLLPIR